MSRKTKVRPPRLFVSLLIFPTSICFVVLSELSTRFMGDMVLPEVLSSGDLPSRHGDPDRLSKDTTMSTVTKD